MSGSPKANAQAQTHTRTNAHKPPHARAYGTCTLCVDNIAMSHANTCTHNPVRKSTSDMYIMTWPAATPMHLYVQVNANKHDSDLPHAQNERNLAFNEQTTQPGTPIGC